MRTRAVREFKYNTKQYEGRESPKDRQIRSTHTDEIILSATYSRSRTCTHTCQPSRSAYRNCLPTLQRRCPHRKKENTFISGDIKHDNRTRKRKHKPGRQKRKGTRTLVVFWFSITSRRRPHRPLGSVAVSQQSASTFRGDTWWEGRGGGVEESSRRTNGTKMFQKQCRVSGVTTPVGNQNVYTSLQRVSSHP